MENYDVENIFSTKDPIKRKEKVNSAVRALCIQEIKKLSCLDYNIDDNIDERDEPQLC